jgi:hypothetical protein
MTAEIHGISWETEQAHHFRGILASSGRRKTQTAQQVVAVSKAKRTQRLDFSARTRATESDVLSDTTAATKLSFRRECKMPP